MQVLVADADPVGRKLVRKILDRQVDHELVGEVDDLGRALDMARQEQPDVVVLSNTLLSDDRNDIPAFIADTASAIVLIAVTGTGAMVWRGMSRGASGYLLKDRLVNDLPQALVAAESGGAFVSPPLTKQLIGYLADRFESEEYDGLTAADIARILLPRERETLLRLAGGESTEEIAAIMSVTTATVRAYVSRILRKLGLRSRGEAIALAYRSRYYTPAA
ncbi:response regulator transcription factor [Micromonospora sp. NPDC049559]|uniref:response regulator transcription factor n=1 Tax=Micromonospora sp. NPDC049559 TaxID=3155923 RepID=UPI00343F54BF